MRRSSLLLYLLPLLFTSGFTGTWPLPDFPGVLTASYGEFRPGHLHQGIDIGTGGQTGFPVVAFRDGWVVRLQSTRRGYGKALFLRHPGGYFTLYAHLDSFSPKIQSLLKKANLPRYFDITLPDADKIPVQEGEVIGYSGETGAGLPHLHFEIRRGWGTPLDPLTFGFPFQDSQPPILEFLTFIPLSSPSLVNGSQAPFILPLAPRDDTPLSVPFLTLQGPVQLELTGYDPGNGLSRLGLTSIYAEVHSFRGDPVFCFHWDIRNTTSSPNTSVYEVFQPLRSHIGPTFFTYRLYALRETGMPCEDRFLQLPKPDDYLLKITVEDASSNLTTTEIPLHYRQDSTPEGAFGNFAEEETSSSLSGGTPPSGLLLPRFSTTPESLRVFTDAGRDTEFVELDLYHQGFHQKKVFSLFPAGGLTVLFPFQGDGLYTVTVTYRSSSGRTVIHQENLSAFPASPKKDFTGTWNAITLQVPKGGFLRDLLVFLVPSSPAEYPEEKDLPFLLPPFRLEPEGEPLLKPATLVIRDERVNRQAGIYSWDPFRMRWRYLLSTVDGKEVKARIDFFQPLALLRDELPPVISSPQWISLSPSRQRWVLPIRDVGSGVNPDSVKVWWNGQKIESEYDEDRGWAWLEVPSTLSGGEWKVEARDYAGNKSYWATPVNFP